MLIRLLIAVKRAALRRRIQRLLSGLDAVVDELDPVSLSWDGIRTHQSDLVLVSERSLPKPDELGEDGLRQLSCGSVVIFLETPDPIAQAQFRGAGADLTVFEGLDDALLLQAISSVVEARRTLLQRTVAAKRSVARPDLNDFVSESPAMKDFLRSVRQIADSDATLLILGETGVGKERLARAIHRASRRDSGPFISVNCGALPDELIESELFGHEAGAFTGASRRRRGSFELAHNGTLFLDEIGEMPSHLQVKLLSALEDRQIRPLGSEKSVPVDVRIIAATNRNLSKEMADGRFRQDLFYRLSVVQLVVPPLRDRKIDIPMLAQSFLEDLRIRVGRPARGVSHEALAAMTRDEWPGNIRELINVLERAILFCDGNDIDLPHLPDDIRSHGAGSLASTHPRAQNGSDDDFIIRPPSNWLELPLKTVRDDLVIQLERSYLRQLLRKTKGRVGEAAELAGIEARTLFSKMKALGFDKEAFKDEDPRRGS